MPIYEYGCLKCGKIHEVSQKISDKPLAKCLVKKCSGKVKKRVSLSSFALKGKGWHSTDYGRAAAKKSSSEKKSEPAVCDGAGGCGKGTCPS